MKLAVQHHNAPTLDRIHRFLRLQRRLGWTMRELDRALAVLSPGAIDGNAIQAVAGVRRLSTALNLPVRDVRSRPMVTQRR